MMACTTGFIRRDEQSEPAHLLSHRSHHRFFPIMSQLSKKKAASDASNWTLDLPVPVRIKSVLFINYTDSVCDSNIRWTKSHH